MEKLSQIGALTGKVSGIMRYYKKRRRFYSNINDKIRRLVPGIKATAIIYALFFIVILYITGFGLKLLHTELLIKDIERNGIDYDAFRSFRVSDDMVQTANQRISHLIKRNPKLKNKMYINTIGYLTFCMMATEYQPTEQLIPDETTFVRGIARIAKTQSFQELYGFYRAILPDLKYFPVPKVDSEYADISYVDTWYALRSYGGNRRHEGTDLMDPNKIRGFFPVISITDGVVENMGWLEQGGYRVGIRSDSGGYFYYAHLNSYAPELKEGDKIIAGQLLGFMGDSGYGEEGTIGKFDVHLHMGIYVQTSLGEMSVNPYWVLQMLEDNRTSYSFE